MVAEVFIVETLYRRLRVANGHRRLIEQPRFRTHYRRARLFSLPAKR